MIDANSNGKPPTWLGLLAEIVRNPNAHAGALFAFFMYLQYRFMVETIQPLVTNLNLLTEAVRQLERTVR